MSEAGTGVANLAPIRKTEVFIDRWGPEIFPLSWRGDPINASAEPMDPGLASEARGVIDRTLAKYPVGVTDDHLRAVYVLGRLQYSGIWAGGTNSRTAVYVAFQSDFPRSAVESNTHAEFSSILLRQFRSRFDEAGWRATLPDGFAYLGTGGVLAIRAGRASLRSDPAMLEQGFFHQYGMSDLENDFNSYAARLFMGDRTLWEAMEVHPRVRAKAEFTMRLYQAIDPSLNRTYFEGLRAAER